MLLTVKLLLGRKCSLKVSGKESVATLKKLVSKRLQILEEQQHLLFRGQLMEDDKCLSDYCIGPNASISVIVRPSEKAALKKTQPSPWPQPLWYQLDQILAKHFRPQDAEAVMQILRHEHQQRLQRVSLEALDQLACYLLREDLPVEPDGEMGPGTLVPEERAQHNKEGEKG